MEDHPTDTVAYEVVAIDNEHGMATVLFFNPYGVGEEDIANPHATKQVRVPFLDNGSIDTEAWAQRLEDQARGVRSRMEAARAVPPVAD